MQVGVKKTKILQNKKSREKKIHYFPKARFISVSDATLPPPKKKKILSTGFYKAPYL